jgi:AcrR family transcriptional regulator
MRSIAEGRIDEAIVQATVRLLAEKGFAEMRMEEVAVLAKVGKPAIYRRYSDKAELVTAVIRSQLTRSRWLTSATPKQSCSMRSRKACPPTGRPTCA